VIHAVILCAILAPLIAWPICCLWDAYRNARTDRWMRRGMRYGVKHGLIRRDAK
jgi:hypothetical protein